MKNLFLATLSVLINTIVYSQKHMDFLKSQIPERFELDEKSNHYLSLKCESVVGDFCSSETFNHIPDKNKLTDKRGIGLKYLDDSALSDSIYYSGVLFYGLLKVIGDSGIKKIIDYREGPLNRVEYDYWESNGSLWKETHYIMGEESITREWSNDKITHQHMSPLKNGTFESFSSIDGLYFSHYNLTVRTDTSYLEKTYQFFYGSELESFQVNYRYFKCEETLEIDYFPGFVMSRTEYILDCPSEIMSFETNYLINKNIESSGYYSYRKKNSFSDHKPTKVGEWSYYDEDQIIKKIVVYDPEGNIIDCKGKCD